MKIALYDKVEERPVQFWTTPDGSVAIRYDLPNGDQVSPVEVGWVSERYTVLEVSEFVAPGGMRVVGDASYQVEDGMLVESFETDDTLEEAPFRRTVRKSVVQTRIIELGKMEAAYAALTANPVYFARWFAPDRPSVYVDDADALILLAAIGCTAEEIEYVMSVEA